MNVTSLQIFNKEQPLTSQSGNQKFNNITNPVESKIMELPKFPKGYVKISKNIKFKGSDDYEKMKEREEDYILKQLRDVANTYPEYAGAVSYIAKIMHPELKLGRSKTENGGKKTLEEIREEEYLKKREQDKQDYLWALSWNDDEAYKQASEKYDKERAIVDERNLFGVDCDEEAEIQKNSYGKYNKDREKYNQIMENKDYYENILKEDLNIRGKSISEIMKKKEGSLDSTIAGYKNIKDDMYGRVIDKMNQEKINGTEEELPNSILLAGPTGCGKTAIAEAVAKEAKCNLVRIPTNTEPKDFPTIVDKVLHDKAKSYYQNIIGENNSIRNNIKNNSSLSESEKRKRLVDMKSPRTIVIIDEFDRYLNPKVADKSIVLANNSYLKTILNQSAKLPKEKGNPDSGNAVTFLFTTNYPGVILGPDSVCDLNNHAKIIPYGVMLPEGENMEDVMRHYMVKGNEIILEHNKTHENKVKDIDVDKMYLSKFVEKYGPSEKDGAFSNDAISFIVPKATEMYIEHPDKGFNLSLLRAFKYSTKDVTPEKLKQYKEEMSSVGLYKEPKDKELKINKTKADTKETRDLKMQIAQWQEWKRKRPAFWNASKENDLIAAQQKLNELLGENTDT